MPERLTCGARAAIALCMSPEIPQFLLVGDEQVSYELRRSHRRTLVIEVYPGARVVVRAPLGCPRQTIEAQLTRSARWLERQVARFRRLESEYEAPRYASGERHLYMGEALPLELTSVAPWGVTRTCNVLRVSVRTDPEPETVKRLLERWYRAEAGRVFGAILTERFAPFESKHLPPTLRIRSMKTRWGSLAGAGRSCRRDEPARMTLNLALIRAPLACIEYVVTHELCHLEYRGHGPRFHALLERLLPDWRVRRQTLNRSGLPLLD